jgi:hypothetical protein
MQTQMTQDEPSMKVAHQDTSSSKERKHTKLGKAINDGLKDVFNGKVGVIRKEKLDDDIKQLLK